MVHAAQGVQPPAVDRLIQHWVTVLRVQHDPPAVPVQRDGGRVEQAERVEEGAEPALPALRVDRGDRVGDRPLAVVVGVDIFVQGDVREDAIVGEVRPEPGAVEVEPGDVPRGAGRPVQPHLPERNLAVQRLRRRGRPALGTCERMSIVAVAGSVPPRCQVQPGDLQPCIFLVGRGGPARR